MLANIAVQLNHLREIRLTREHIFNPAPTKNGIRLC